MKKAILHFFILIITLTGNAQAPTAKTLLWEISGNGIAQPSYLFGTIHVMCPDDIKMPGIVKTKFNNTKQLYLEIDMSDPDMMKNAMKLMKMKDSTTLQQLYGSRYDTINQLFKSITGIPLAFMSTTKPMMIMSAILPSVLGCMPASWESIFQQMAEAKNIKIKGLETLQDQMDVFDSIPYLEQADMLAKTIMNMDSSKMEIKKMLDVYNKKDIEQMNILTINDGEMEKYENILLTRRNKNWIPVIGNEAKKQSTFFAFGAGHLGGEKGVINLLKKAGYKVKPVMY